MGLSVMLHLLRYRGLAVVHYSGVPCNEADAACSTIAQLRNNKKSSDRKSNRAVQKEAIICEHPAQYIRCTVSEYKNAG